MLYLYKIFFHNKWILSLFGLALFLNISSWVYVLVMTMGKKMENFYLHYNVVLGVDLLGPWWKLLVIPGAGIAVLIINLLFSFLMFNRNRVLSIVLAVITLFFEIFAFWALYLIFRINL